MWSIFTSLFFDFLEAEDYGRKKNLKGFQNLPIYLWRIYGSCGWLKGVEKQKEMYETHGLKEVSLVLYPEGRHEMLNEINRDEVIEDIVRWLNKILI